MAAFFASETAAWLMLFIGTADVLIGWLWLGRGRGLQEAEKEIPSMRRWLPAIFLFDVLLIGAGLYGLRLNGVL